MKLRPHHSIFLRRCAGMIFLVSSWNLAFAGGPFDPTFAGHGIYPYSGFFRGDTASADAITRDAQGRLLVATSFRTQNQMAVTRHSTDGIPDLNFGNFGIASDFFYLESGDYSEASAIAVDHRNRILLAGGVAYTMHCPSRSTTFASNFAMVRLLNDHDGAVDLGFGTFGTAVFGDCLHTTQGIRGISIGADDSIFAIGAIFSEPRPEKLSVIKWGPDGRVDQSFGRGGTAAYSLPMKSSYGTSIATDSHGRIIVTMITFGTGTDRSGEVLRFTANGTLDTEFGDGGVVELGMISPDIYYSPGDLCCVQIDSKDRPVIAGIRAVDTAGNSRTFIARFTDKGVPDKTFGDGSVAFLEPSAMSYVTTLAVDQRNRPIIAGAKTSTSISDVTASVVQLNLDGTINSSLGYGGIFSADVPSSATSLVVDGGGRINLTAVDVSEGETKPILMRIDQLFGDGFE